MAKIMERVLYYNPGTPEALEHVALMKSVLVRMGIRIKNVGPDQVMEKVGYLAGIPGYEAAGENHRNGEDAEAGTEGMKAGAGEESPEALRDPAQALPVIPVQMMVLYRLSNSRLDQLLVNLRKAGVPKIELKAVLTEHNCGWTFYHLYQELKEEHETMTAGKKQ